MDEINHNPKPKRTRVLRAADVMPPFDKDPAQTEGGEKARSEEGKKVEEVNAAAVYPCDAPAFSPSCNSEDEGESPSRDSASQDPGSEQSPAAREIPRYDLAENILAEQRRVAAGRRRSPGQDDAEKGKRKEGTNEEAPDVSSPSGPSLLSSPCPEPTSEDLMELQRIVTEIVARDIERLCRKQEDRT